MIEETLARKADISNAAPGRFVGMRAAADALSLRNVDQSICELLNEALARLVELLYEEADGAPVNVDAATGRVLIPVPWGRNGAPRWGLRVSEADSLRWLMLSWTRAETGSGVAPLLVYDRSRKCWYLSRRFYPTLADARRWLARHQVTVAVLRQVRAGAIDRTVDNKARRR